jgi:hypothetical protein
MKKLLLILLCLPTIGFGQNNFYLGGVMGISFNNSTGLLNPPEYAPSWDYPKSKTNITMTEGVSIRYNLLDMLSLNSKILYHISGYTRTYKGDWENLHWTDMIHPSYGFNYPADENGSVMEHKHLDYYITLPITIQYHYHNIFIAAGGYCAYLLKSEDSFDEFGYIDVGMSLNDNSNKLDLGMSLGVGFDYSLNNIWSVKLEVSTLYGLTDYYTASLPLSEFYKRSYIGLFGVVYNLKQ